MSADACSDWCRLRAGFSCRFTYRDGALHVEWAPRLPTKRQMWRVYALYTAARERFLASALPHLKVCTVDLLTEGDMVVRGLPPVDEAGTNDHA